MVLGWIASLSRDASGFALHVSARTLPAFLAGAVVGLVYWKIVALVASGRRVWLLRAASGLLLLGAVTAFLYPLRFVPREALPDIAQGLGGAVVVLSMIGFMVRTLTRSWRRMRRRGENADRRRDAAVREKPCEA